MIIKSLGILITLIGSLPSVIIGRIIVGITSGINMTIIPIYINEMSPKEIAGLMGSYIQTILNIGILLAYAFGNFINLYTINQDWGHQTKKCFKDTLRIIIGAECLHLG